MAAKQQTVYYIDNIRVLNTQLPVLNLLEPGWLILEKSAIHGRTRASLEKRNWIEVRIYPDYMMVRLTLEGKDIRDKIHTRNARRANKEKWKSKNTPAIRKNNMHRLKELLKRKPNYRAERDRKRAAIEKSYG